MKQVTKIRIVMILLSLHLLYCNADLLIINAGIDLAASLNGLAIMKIVWLLIVAVSYSVLSSMSVVDVSQKWLIVVFGIFDAIGVLIQKYEINSLIGVYFAAYTFWMILMCWKMFSDKHTDITNEQKAEEYDMKTEILSWHRRIAGKVKNKTPEEKQLIIASIIDACDNADVKAVLVEHYKVAEVSAAKQLTLDM